jgi:hypothetical protein
MSLSREKGAREDANKGPIAFENAADEGPKYCEAGGGKRDIKSHIEKY